MRALPYTRRSRLLCISLLCGVIAACGGGNDSDKNDNGGGGTPAPVRGSLIQSPPAKQASYGASDLLATLGGGDLGQLILQLAFSPKCSIDIFHLEYNTVGGGNEATTASGALMVPSGSDASCQGARPIVLYAHGTTSDKTFNIADISKSNNTEGLLIAAIFAAQGYIVVAPNYAGYDTSTLAYHPYLNATQQSGDMIDALTAARSALPGVSSVTSDGGKLFITDYSQGGYVAMATQRALQQAGKTVTAAGPMSGPYALSAFGDAVFYGDVDIGAPIFATFLVSSYQHAYGNIYTNLTDVFEAKYATGIDSLLPTTLTGSLAGQGKLPATALFSSTPPAPAFAAYTPSTSPAALAPIFALGFGTDHLITNNFRLSYLQDAQLSPDGGFPTTTDDKPPANPANGFRQALKTNDLRNWTPSAPVLMCAGDQDPEVFYLNTQLMQGYWAMYASNAPVTVLDVDSSALGGDPYATYKNGFAAAKTLAAATAVAGGAGDGGASAVAQSYHAGLVPPFCVAAVSSFFAGF